jgi:hypothetical protein
VDQPSEYDSDGDSDEEEEEEKDEHTATQQTDSNGTDTDESESESANASESDDQDRPPFCRAAQTFMWEALREIRGVMANKDRDIAQTYLDRVMVEKIMLKMAHNLSTVQRHLPSSPEARPRKRRRLAYEHSLAETSEREEEGDYCSLCDADGAERHNAESWERHCRTRRHIMRRNAIQSSGT